MEENMNIPRVSVDALVNQLESMYTSAIRAGVPFRRLPTPFLWGPPGIGKSQAIFQLAERLEALGYTVPVTDVRLLLFSPVDLRGVPMADEHRRFTDWLCPRIFDMSASEKTINILLLDELSAAPQSVQAAAYQICLDRRVGEHRLPENCIVMAAGNRTTDNAVAFRMSSALANRLMHWEVRPDYESWKAWAYRRGIHPKVIAYLGADNSRMCEEPGISGLAYPTPRSWEFVSTLLRTVNEDPGQIRSLLAACIGVDTAMEFETFCSGCLHMPSVADILAGRCGERPESYDVTYALTAALVSHVRQRWDEITADELEHLCAYAVRFFPRDFVESLLNDIRAVPGMSARLMKCHSAQRWLSAC